EAIVEQEKIECEFTRVPGYLHAPVKGGVRDERESLREDASLANELGFDATCLECVPKMQTPGVRFANQAKFHPHKYLAKLAELISTDGSQILEESAAGEFDTK